MHVRTRSRNGSLSSSPNPVGNSLLPDGSSSTSSSTTPLLGRPTHRSTISAESAESTAISASTFTSTSTSQSHRIPIIYSNSNGNNGNGNGSGAGGLSPNPMMTSSANHTPVMGNRSPSMTPRLSIRAPSMMLHHSPPTQFEKYLNRPFTSYFSKLIRPRRSLFFLLLTSTMIYFFWITPSSDLTSNELVKHKALITSCKLFPWKKDCIGIHSPFDYLHFEQLNGYIIYPAHQVRKSSSSSSSSPSDSLQQENYLGSRRKSGLTPNEGDNAAVPAQPHPIHMLMDSAKRSYEKKIARQSKTLREAVEEYERRYSRRPPKGFADWWWYAKGHNFIFVDEFDSLNDNILPFYALPASVVQDRANKIQHDSDFWIQDKTYTLEMTGNGKIVQEHGPMKDHALRPEQMKKLIQPIAKYLPDINITFTGHDNPWIVMSGEAREQHIQAAKVGEYVSTKLYTDPLDDWKFDGWAQSCPPNSPIRKAPRLMERLTEQGKKKPQFKKSLISDHVAAMDVCSHPERQTLHGFTLWDGPRPGLAYPLFSMTSTLMHSDLLIPPIDQYDRPVGNDPKWEDKKRDKIVWRGTTTGADLNLAWMRDYSQRPRLCRLPQQKGTLTLTYAPNDKHDKLGPTEEFTAQASELAEHYFDFQFLGKREQCGDPIACAEFEKQFTWSQFMSQDEQNEYKYMIDVDGNGWSGRFHRLLSTNSLVFKSTIFPEWYRDHIQPWLHYVPISTDYSDLWEVMAFFKGDSNGKGEHDALAKEIALAGKEFAKTCWRMEDMRIYTYRLLLEYARILHRNHNDPTSMDM